jgi:hypothetical protein
MRISDLHPGDRFKADVTIPLVGASPTTRNLTFRYRDKPALKIFVEKMEQLDDLQMVQEVVLGWDLEDEFTPENVRAFLDHVPEAAICILRTYMRESGLKVPAAI